MADVGVTGAAARRPPVTVVALGGAAIAFIVLPLAGLLGRVAWSDLISDVTSPETLTALRLSLVCSTLAAGLCLVLGLPLAWTLATTSFRGKSIVRALVLLPMVLPPVVGGVALLAAFGGQGIIGGLLVDRVHLTFTTAGVVMAETFVALPFFVVTVEGALRSVDPRYDEVAATLGARQWLAMRRVTLPLIGPSIAAGLALSWARALGEFGATITFAGNIEGRTRTLPLAVYLALESDPEGAIAASVVLLAISVVIIVALRGRWTGVWR